MTITRSATVLTALALGLLMLAPTAAHAEADKAKLIGTWEGFPDGDDGEAIGMQLRDDHTCTVWERDPGDPPQVWEGLWTVRGDKLVVILIDEEDGEIDTDDEVLTIVSAAEDVLKIDFKGDQADFKRIDESKVPKVSAGEGGEDAAAADDTM